MSSHNIRGEKNPQEFLFYCLSGLATGLKRKKKAKQNPNQNLNKQNIPIQSNKKKPKPKKTTLNKTSDHLLPSSKEKQQGIFKLHYKRPQTGSVSIASVLVSI